MSRVCGLDDQFPAGYAGPGRDSVSPPDLPGYTPVPDIVHPAIECVVPGFGIDLDVFAAYRLYRLICQWLDFNEPLD